MRISKIYLHQNSIIISIYQTNFVLFEKETSRLYLMTLFITTHLFSESFGSQDILLSSKAGKSAEITDLHNSRRPDRLEKALSFDTQKLIYTYLKSEEGIQSNSKEPVFKHENSTGFEKSIFCIKTRVPQNQLRIVN